MYFRGIFFLRTRQICASIAGLLQTNLTQLSVKIASRKQVVIQSSGYLARVQVT